MSNDSDEIKEYVRRIAEAFERLATAHEGQAAYTLRVEARDAERWPQVEGWRSKEIACCEEANSTSRFIAQTNESRLELERRLAKDRIIPELRKLIEEESSPE